MKITDPYYKQVYRILHSSVDRITEAAAAVNLHADILDPGNEDGTMADLFKAQSEAGGSEAELQFLQMIVTASTNLLIQHRSQQHALDGISMGSGAKAIEAGGGGPRTGQSPPD